MDMKSIISCFATWPGNMACRIVAAGMDDFLYTPVIMHTNMTKSMSWEGRHEGVREAAQILPTMESVPIP
jgi:hypothetical protein